MNPHFFGVVESITDRDHRWAQTPNSYFQEGGEYQFVSIHKTATESDTESSPLQNKKARQYLDQYLWHHFLIRPYIYAKTLHHLGDVVCAVGPDYGSYVLCSRHYRLFLTRPPHASIFGSDILSLFQLCLVPLLGDALLN